MGPAAGSLGHVLEIDNADGCRLDHDPGAAERHLPDPLAGRGEAKFVSDFIDAWTKVMKLDRFDVEQSGREGMVASR